MNAHRTAAARRTLAVCPTLAARPTPAARPTLAVRPTAAARRTLAGLLAGALFALGAGCSAAEPLAPPSPPGGGPVVGATTAVFEGQVTDPVRSRRIPYRVHHPVAVDRPGPLPVVLLSHGGFGSERGHRSAPWLAPGLAARGYVAIQLGHLPSVSVDVHLTDRPADVSHLLDRLAGATLPLPEGLAGRLGTDRVAHLGHSMGAYTAHAVGGATLTHAPAGFRDPRVQVLVPFSPQGPDRFGFFDAESPASLRPVGLPPGVESSWGTVVVPALSVVGAREMDGQPASSASRPGWRRIPFVSYAPVSDQILLVLPGQDHSDLWNTAPPAVQRYLVEAVADFLDVYLAGRSLDGCGVGEAYNALAVRPERRSGEGSGSRLGGCVGAGADR